MTWVGLMCLSFSSVTDKLASVAPESMRTICLEMMAWISVDNLNESTLE